MNPKEIGVSPESADNSIVSMKGGGIDFNSVTTVSQKQVQGQQHKEKWAAQADQSVAQAKKNYQQNQDGQRQHPVEIVQDHRQISRFWESPTPLVRQ
jgi:copper homeostasis protein CutC